MRLLSLSLPLALTLLIAASTLPAHAARITSPGALPAAHAQAKPQAATDDGSRVKVQIVVLCSAVVLVVVIGTGAYFLRKQLGLTAPPPKQDAGGHH